MSNTKKLLLGCLCSAFVIAASIFGTLAYLTDRDSAVNTFTVGLVEISLDESSVDEDGNIIDENGDGVADSRTNGNEYHLVPGQSYIKDPQITIKAGSSNAYVRIFLTVHNASAVQNIIDAYNLSNFSSFINCNSQYWVYEGYYENAEDNTISFEYRYYTTVSAETVDVVLPPLFTRLTVPGLVTCDEMHDLYSGGFKMELIGHAIQAAGFDSEDAAWAAFGEQRGA